MGLTKIYENKSLYKKERKGFKVTPTWQKKQSSVKPQRHISPGQHNDTNTTAIS